MKLYTIQIKLDGPSYTNVKYAVNKALIEMGECNVPDHILMPSRTILQTYLAFLSSMDSDTDDALTQIELKRTLDGSLDDWVERYNGVVDTYDIRTDATVNTPNYYDTGYLLFEAEFSVGVDMTYITFSK